MTTEVIWNTFSQKLFIFINSKVKNIHDSEDLLQDVFFKIHNNLDNLKNLKKVESWIYQITRNTINDYFRKNQNHDSLQEEIMTLPEADMDFRKEIAQCLIALTDQLPQKYRTPLIDVYVEGKTQKTIAAEIGLSLPGVKSRVQRGRAILKNTLKDSCNIESTKEPIDCDCDC